MQIAITQYNAGNIFSVVNALKRVGLIPIITAEHEKLLTADAIILPGQGAAHTTMNSLKAAHLDTLIPTLKQPVLGICIGQQLMCQHSTEGDTACLGIFEDVDVLRFDNANGKHKVPHMGWNTYETTLENPLLADIDNPYVYYIHSYYAPVNPYTIATTDYILPFSAAMQKDNFYATQFHPEKSGDVGEQILRNFIDIVRKG